MGLFYIITRIERNFAMKKNYQSDLIDKILDRIPAASKPASYIADILGIDYNAASARLKQMSSFTFGEILTLAKELNLSVDELLGKSPSGSAVFYMDEPYDFVCTFRRFTEILEKMYYAKDNSIIISVNRLLFISVYRFPALFKFTFFKQQREKGLLPDGCALADVLIPDELTSLINQCIRYRKKLNITLIYDRNFVFNTLNEINFYVDRGVIDPYEVKTMKDELKELMEYIYNYSTYGTLKNNIHYDIYFSSIDIENNVSYVTYANHTTSYIWTQPEYCIYTCNPFFCEIQKNWLESLKRFSTLISASNSQMQTKLYTRAVNQIDTLL